MAGRAANLNPKSFKETPLCELCFEDALQAGIRRSEKLKPAEFMETSFRFCVEGLHSWLENFVNSYCNCSLRTAVRDISWQWASFCETDPVLVRARSGFEELSREIIENSAYTDLADELRDSIHLREFIPSRDKWPLNFVVPVEVIGIIGHTGDALGISSLKFLQVGLAWSLSTNKRELYRDWSSAVLTPLFSAVMRRARERADYWEETRMRLYLRQGRKEEKS